MRSGRRAAISVDVSAPTEERCPTCRTPVPEGATRCPGCGRVFGEQNRCPHCNAVAAVIARGGRTVCAACGKPRAGDVVLGPTAELRPETRAMIRRARARGQRALGVASITSGVLAALLVAALVSGGTGVMLAVLVALLGGALGALSIRAGARGLAAAQRDVARELERRVLDLAAKEGGELTATHTATALGVSVEDADAALTALVGDGSRVSVEVDDDGVLSYVFRELVPRPSRARVEIDDEVEAEVPVAPRRAERKQG